MAAGVRGLSQAFLPPTVWTVLLSPSCGKLHPPSPWRRGLKSLTDDDDVVRCDRRLRMATACFADALRSRKMAPLIHKPNLYDRNKYKLCSCNGNFSHSLNPQASVLGKISTDGPKLWLWESPLKECAQVKVKSVRRDPHVAMASCRRRVGKGQRKDALVGCDDGYDAKKEEDDER